MSPASAATAVAAAAPSRASRTPSLQAPRAATIKVLRCAKSFPVRANCWRRRMAETSRSKRSARMSIKPSCGGPAAAFIARELTASSANAARTSLSLASRRICDSPSCQQHGTDQSGPAEQRGTGAKVKEIEVGWKQSDRRKARDAERKHEARHGGAKRNVAAIDPNIEQHCGRRPQDNRQRHIVDRRAKVADDEMAAAVR